MSHIKAPTRNEAHVVSKPRGEHVATVAMTWATLGTTCASRNLGRQARTALRPSLRAPTKLCTRASVLQCLVPIQLHATMVMPASVAYGRTLGCRDFSNGCMGRLGAWNLH